MEAKPEVPIANPTTIESDTEDDPITASYSVYLNPALPLGRRLYVLQQPNRTDDVHRAAPRELRLKANSGMVELDLPMVSSTDGYDREKGLRWGRTLRNSMAAKSGGSHGLAGGFGFGAVQQRGAAGKKAAAQAAEEEDEPLDWNEAVRQNKVLHTLTLGGQNPDAGEVQYMVGVFQGKDLHLTPVSSLVHLRPQLHHIDATAQAERNAASAASAANREQVATTAPAARAIHMTIKTTPDGDAVTTETMGDRLRTVQSEPWRRLRYTDEHDEAAWDVYNESLFLRPQGQAASAEPDPGDKVPRFSSKWDDDQLLEAVSGIERSRMAREAAEAAELKQKQEAEAKAKRKVKEEAEAAAAAAAAAGAGEERQTKTRPRGGATASAATRRGRGARSGPS